MRFNTLNPCCSFYSNMTRRLPRPRLSSNCLLTQITFPVISSFGLYGHCTKLEIVLIDQSEVICWTFCHRAVVKSAICFVSVLLWSIDRFSHRGVYQTETYLKCPNRSHGIFTMCSLTQFMIIKEKSDFPSERPREGKCDERNVCRLSLIVDLQIFFNICPQVFY